MDDPDAREGGAAPRPIVIIADDLSGAAELAGIAYSRGYSAEVQRRFDPNSNAEVIAVDTDSRGLQAENAAAKVTETTRAIAASLPAWIFKKVDSVLRGNVLAEIEALINVTRQPRCLLVPANPSRGRTIHNGRLLIGGVPLDQTEFARDPEHPRHSPSVAELLGGNCQGRGRITAPDVTQAEQLPALAARIGDDCLAAGAADFFAACLDARGAGRPEREAPPGPTIELPALLVCGSRGSWLRRAGECASRGIPMQSHPPLFTSRDISRDGLSALGRQSANRLASAGRLLIGIGDIESEASPSALRDRLAELTAQILAQTPIKTLLLEGGATAAAVTQRLGWTRLGVACAAPAGIGVLQPLGASAAPQVWLKPGSYPWPEAVWLALGRP